MAEDVGVWELPYYEPFNRWTRNNAVLVGDAAHPVGLSADRPPLFCAPVSLALQMLPFGAQGANQAIEDAGALGVLFDAVQAGCQVHERLELFEKIRRKRASMIQVLSSVRIGREQAVTDALLQFADPGHEKCQFDPTTPAPSPGRTFHTRLTPVKACRRISRNVLLTL